MRFHADIGGSQDGPASATATCPATPADEEERQDGERDTRGPRIHGIGGDQVPADGRAGDAESPDEEELRRSRRRGFRHSTS
jgi:hypothetical protein